MKTIILLFLIAFGSIQSAPTDGKSLYSVVENDNRTQKLRDRPFVKGECRKSENLFSRDICVVLFDVAIEINNRNLEYSDDVINTGDTSFCDSLLQVLPDSPSNETTKAFKNQVGWFKDELKKNQSLCKTDCFYTDQTSYATNIKPVCQFVYNQYKLLRDQNTSQQQQQKAPEEPKINKTADVKSEVSESIASVISEAGSGATSPPVSNVLPAGNIEKVKLESAPIQQFPATNDSHASAQLNESNAQNENKVVELSPPIVAQSPTTKKIEIQSTIPKDETPKMDPVKPEEPLKNELDQGDSPLEIENGGSDVFDEAAQSESPIKDLDLNGDFDGDAADQNMDDDGDDDDYNLDKKGNIQMNDANVVLPEAPVDDDEVHHKRIVTDNFEEEPDSNFFTYLCILMFLCIALYILFHNKQKILALVLEGRRGSRRSRERSRGGSKAAYSKLDCNLEEAITSKKSMSGKSMDIIY